MLATLILGFASPQLLWAQGVLENPSSGSFQSGIGLVSGWKCTANTITVSFDGGPPIQAAYGTSREDTRGVCGDANNGFGLLFNWNLLGNGTHTVRALADGVQFASATFTVTTLGTEFLTGQSSTCNATLAGQNVTLSWQQSQQNFVITSASGGGGGGTTLDSLVGRWEFSYIIISTFFDHYSLPQPTFANGIPVIRGTDLDAGGPMFATRIQDLVPGSPLPFTFALLDPDIALCDFFVFNKTGPNTLSGQHFLATKDSAGNCGALTGTPHPMSAVRISSIPILLLQSLSQQEAVEQRKTEEESRQTMTRYFSEESSSVGEDALIEMLLRLQGIVNQ